MPILPLIDLCILLAWTSFIWAFIHKVVQLAMDSAFTVLGYGPGDFVLGGGVALLFALTLAARQWVRGNELNRQHQTAAQSVEVFPDFPDPREQAAAAVSEDVRQVGR